MTNTPIPGQPAPLAAEVASAAGIQATLQSHLERLQAFFGSRPEAATLQQICTSLMTGRLREFTVSFIEHALPQALRDEHMLTSTLDCPQAAQAGYFVAVTVLPRLDPEAAHALLPGSYLTYLDTLMEEMGQCEDLSPREETLGVTPWAHFVHWVYCCDGQRAQVHLTLMTEALKKGAREIAILAEDLLTPQEQQEVLGRSRSWESRRPPPVSSQAPVSTQAPVATETVVTPPPVPSDVIDSMFNAPSSQQQRILEETFQTGSVYPPAMAAKPVLSPWKAVAACVLSFTVGEVLFLIIDSFLRDWALPANASNLMYMIFRYGAYLVSGAALGLLLGGLLTGWKKHWLWAGAFATAQMIIYLVLTILPGFRSILLLFLTVYGLQGLANGLTFGLLARSEPAYRQPEPLLRLLLAGLGVYLLVGLLNFWLSNSFLFSNGMLVEPYAQYGSLVLLVMYTVFGLLEGFGMGLGLEMPRLGKGE